ncbi:hypothetical protein E0Z10_g2176 [Xylaria hypoxylon]|uniref:Ketoreductase (KR) domain-containing protein n=1 Tax=Xylaria hypoxylon TaxID=37992 RepID=A0A4Z0YRR5_9PEZI|nr:hypothetical protein E0Z10_g2176 [Xylaria hypoxylon]
MPGMKFDKSSISDLARGVLLMTGVGKHNPDHIFFTGRNAKAADKTIQHIKAVRPNVNATFVARDLASLATVWDAANKILAESNRLDLFLANASIMAQPGAGEMDAIINAGHR